MSSRLESAWRSLSQWAHLSSEAVEVRFLTKAGGMMLGCSELWASGCPLVCLTWAYLLEPLCCGT